MSETTNHEIVSHEEWIAQRKTLLAKEKEFNRLRDELSAERRALAWERVTKKYAFETTRGSETLEQLFDGRSQLVIYHAMFDPKTATDKTPYTKDAPCASCSFWLDNIEQMVVHLAQNDVTLIAASRAPLEKLEAYKKRLDWTFNWVSTGDGDFNHDFGVTLTADEIASGTGQYNYRATLAKIAELPGISVFTKNADGIFHTYSTYSRGLDMLNVGYHYLDLVPKGRNEAETNNRPAWLRRRDEYANVEHKACH